MPIERQATQGLGTVARQRVQPQIIDRTQRVGTVGEGTNLLGDLIKAAQVGGAVYSTHLKKKIAEDQARQTDRAFLGQAPSDDSTVAGYRAHAVVRAQNLVLQHTTRMKDEASRFTGTDQEWEDLVTQGRSNVQDNIYENYPSLAADPDMPRIWGTLFSEQAPAIATSRIAGKLQQEHTSRVQAFQDNIVQRSHAGLSQEELSSVMDSVMTDTAPGLKLTKLESETMLEKAAVDAANNGDLSLLEYTKTYKGGRESSLYELSPQLQKAEITGKKIIQGQDVASIIAWENKVSTAYLAGEMDDDQLGKAINAVNKVNPGTIGVDFGTSLFNKRATLRAKESELDDYLTAYDNPGVRLGSIGAPVKDLNKVASAKWVETQKLIQLATQQDPENADAIKRTYMAQYANTLADNGMTNPNWSASLTSVANTDLSNSDATSLPANTSEGLSLWRSLDRGVRDSMTTTETATILNNFDYFLDQGLTEAQALGQAQKSVKNKQPLTSEQRTEIQAEAKDIVAGEIQGFFESYIPDGWQVDVASEYAREALTVTMAAGAASLDVAKERVKEGIRRNFSVVNGQLVRGSRRQIASEMGVNQEDLDAIMISWGKGHEDEFLNKGVEVEDLQYEFLPGRGAVIFRNGKYGDAVSRPISLKEIGAYPRYAEMSALNEAGEGKAGWDYDMRTAHVPRGNPFEIQPDRNISLVPERFSLSPPPEVEPEVGPPAPPELVSPHGTTLPIHWGPGEFKLDEPEMGRSHSYEGPTHWLASERVDERKPIYDPKTQENRMFSTIVLAENNVKPGVDQLRTNGWRNNTFFGFNVQLGEGKVTDFQVVGFGHKLTPQEVNRGFILFKRPGSDTAEKFNINPQSNKYKPISMEVAKEIAQADLNSYIPTFKKNIKGYDSLPPKYQYILQATAYQVGAAGALKLKKMIGHMQAGNDQGVFDEMFIMDVNEKRSLARRRETADAVGLVYKEN